VAGERTQPDRVLRRDGIEPCSRERRIVPGSIRELAFDQPAGRRALDLRAKRVGDLIEAWIEGQRQAIERGRDRNMRVRVVDAGNDRAPAQIDASCAFPRKRADRARLADRGDAIAGDRHRLCPRLRRVGGEDLAINEDCVGPGRTGARA